MSVSYSDVSQPAQQMFSIWPVLEAKFPHDFFYPFVSSDSLSVISSRLSPAIFIFQFCMLLQLGK